MKVRHAFVFAALWPGAALAGPPFLTDDPEPTDTGHWEIYAPLFEAEGSGRDFEGQLGAEINYGPAENWQITVGLPAAYRHDARGWHWGAGDLEASVKYRFYHNERAGLQIAFFPGITGLARQPRFRRRPRHCPAARLGAKGFRPLVAVWRGWLCAQSGGGQP